eukprot:Phypoly_transcript_09515.p1 GENE.Phypoly_transcript_09515~~Phypoly_transcript_09515.p1  ORF type:complete len:317 (+),score=55.69 Phypoly_transcript_09515:165-1115(+)
MVSPTNDEFPSLNPAPLAWKEFRRRSGFTTQPKVYVYDASPQIVPQSPPISTLTLSPIICAPLLGQESPRREHSGYLVSHVSQALQALGSSTGGNIADYIASNFCNEQGVPYEKGRKLHYMVNAILSSPKYKYLFQKDQILKDEKRSLWRLKRPEEFLDEDTSVPPGMSLSSLIPTSPHLSLKQSRDDIELITTTPIPTATPTPIFNTPSFSTPSTDTYGGSNEGHDGKQELPRTTEHPHTVPSPTITAPLSPSPTTPDPSSPILDGPSLLALSSRRKKRKGSGLDSSLGLEGEFLKQVEEQPIPEEKKRRLDVAA